MKKQNTSDLLKTKKIGYVFYSYSGTTKYQISEVKIERKKYIKVVDVDTGEIYDFDYFKRDIILTKKEIQHGTNKHT